MDELSIEIPNRTDERWFSNLKLMAVAIAAIWKACSLPYCKRICFDFEMLISIESCSEYYWKLGKLLNCKATASTFKCSFQGKPIQNTMHIANSLRPCTEFGFWSDCFLIFNCLSTISCGCNNSSVYYNYL